MLLNIDLGNTSVSAAIFKRTQLLTSRRFLYDGFPNNFKKWLNSGVFNLSNCLICSVNPKLEPKLFKFLTAYNLRNKVKKLRNSQIPVRNKYKNKNQVGIDRLVNVYGGVKLYGSPCLVIDLGSAITFDLGGPEGSFEGGLIFVGPKLALGSLQKGTAKIGSFDVDFTPQKNLLGKSTRECVAIGISLGFGRLVQGVIDEFKRYSKRRWNKKLKVIVTGGYVNLVKPYLAKDDVCDEFLTLKALAHLHFSGGKQ